jgi:hypothetical protein
MNSGIWLRLWNGNRTLEMESTSWCHPVIEQQLQVEKVLLATPCTHALEMAAMLLEIE